MLLRLISKMVKLIIVAILMATAVMAGPTEKVLKDGDISQKIESNAHLRFRRVTCDLLSIGGDTACAAHCLTMGKAGGHCEGGICICRRDTFSDVWEQKFGPENRRREQEIRDWVARHQPNSQ